MIGQFQAVAAFPPEKEPLLRMLDRSQSWSGYAAKGKNPCPYWQVNDGHSANSQVTERANKRDCNKL
jgi:hypothetical protein